MTTRLLLRRRLVISLGVLLGLLPPARAQVSFDISPYAGLFVPLRSMFVQPNPAQVYYDQYGTGATVALQKKIAVGGRLTVWPRRRFGIEATFGYAPSGVTIGCRAQACNEGHVVVASVKVVVPLLGVSSLRSFYLGGGTGLVDLRGRAYEGVAVPRSVAGTVGAGWELKAASAWSLRIEAEDYLFRPHFGFEGCAVNWGICRVLSWKQQFQHAVILSIGWVFRTGGPRR